MLIVVLVILGFGFFVYWFTEHIYNGDDEIPQEVTMLEDVDAENKVSEDPNFPDFHIH